jgi:pteridine reductase
MSAERLSATRYPPTALITGAAVRVGRALALALAEDGHRVIAHYGRSESEAASLVAEIHAAGGEAVALQADLAGAEEVERLAREAESVWDGVDVLVNNASVFPPEPLLETDAELWDRTLAVNLRAPFLLTRALAPGMKRRGRGLIVNLADLAGLQAWKGYAAHGVSKAGLVHLTRSAARALAPEVRVNAIAPGTVLPPDDLDDAEVEALARRAPLGRIGSPADVVAALRYLVAADFVTGEVLTVDGGRVLG